VIIEVPVVDPTGGFNADLNWRQRPSEKLDLHLVEYDIPPHEQLLKDYGDDWDLAVRDLFFELQLRIIAEPRPLQLPLQRDWYRRFCPGGLPSLGRRT